ncbi:hypothetical protein [Herbidospora mongoliensis]|uniref:hypothetical protein n=1 Tax=Herbidospora mongoliensis TaxID=688067 RepID=UPI000833D168|nr:hypothetical protein [Herbidospora mongoliensis]
MLRLYDTRHRLVEPLLPPGSRSLRLYTCGPIVHRSAHIGDLRSYLLSDLIQRVLGRSSVRVAAHQSPNYGAESPRSDMLALNMRPVDPEPIPARAIDLMIEQCSPEHPAEVSSTHWAHGGHLLFDGREMAENVVLLGDVVSKGLDPLSVRLAFMEHRYRDQMNLTWDALHEADRTIKRWRRAVAKWAESPSLPIAKSYADAMTGAFEADLDTPRALKLLRDLEKDPEPLPGSKFETVMHIDQILALDLAIDIGKPQ